jgi:ribosomal protein S18 acetylase RimI-like enzyme
LLAKTLELDLHLRTATASDHGFIAHLAERVFTSYGSYDRYLADWLEDETVSARVAALGDEPVGFYMLAEYEHPERSEETIGDLLAIAVDPAHQSRGIGRSLLRDAIELAGRASSSPTEMWLFVAEGNSRGQRLFARHGFRFRRGVGVYPAGQRALAMVKRLKSTNPKPIGVANGG